MGIFFALLQTQNIKDVLKEKTLHSAFAVAFFHADFQKGRCKDGFYTSTTNAEPIMTALLQLDITNIKGQRYKILLQIY